VSTTTVRPYRILLTGSRDWIDGTMLLRVLAAWRERCAGGILVHGACPSGADFMAATLWQRRWGLPVEPHPARWAFGRSAGPRRNQEMVDLGADVCLVFPLPTSRGSIGCGRMAERAGIPTWWYWPDRVVPGVAGPRMAA
jgi:hypothetical protein